MPQGTNAFKRLGYGGPCPPWGGRVTPEREYGRIGCIVQGCEGQHHARGYCKIHYLRWRRAQRKGNMRANHKTCKAPTCGRPAKTRGYCPKHYQQVRTHGRLTPEREHSQYPPVCIVEGCSGNPVGRAIVEHITNRFDGMAELPLNASGLMDALVVWWKVVRKSTLHGGIARSIITYGGRHSEG